MQNFKTRLTSTGRSAAIKRGLAQKREAMWRKMVCSWLICITVIIVSTCVFFNFFQLKFQNPVLMTFRTPVWVEAKWAAKAQTIVVEAPKEAEGLTAFRVLFKQELSKYKLTQEEKDKRVAYVDMAWKMAKDHGWKDEDALNLLKILKCESGFDQYADLVNIHKQKDGKVLTTLDRGIAQWNQYFHPEVADACVWDGACAIDAMINKVQLDGGFGQWACANKVL